MITCKEDLMNTYIENDFGELRDLYLAKCEDFGLKTGADRLLQDGAFDHYDSECFEVLYDGKVYFPSFKNLSQNSRKLTLSDMKPKRVKVVYEKVEFDNVGQCVQSVHDNYGGYFFFNNGTGEYQLAEYQDSAWYWKEDNIYIKVEKEIDWREEVHSKFQSSGYHWSTPIGEVINDESDCFLELCRVTLRATGELE